ncbi:MAG: InlB B-repeat-containing protein [Firmicutes bacterium]|nr:InlB B-repeat-containing protein [Bacillota bacterium]
MDIKKIFLLLMFTIAIVSIISPVNADEIDANSKNVKFKKIEVKLTLDANGGKLWDEKGGKFKSIVSKNVKKGSPGTISIKPQRSGYDFKGWYTKKSGGTKIDKKVLAKKSVTYYAQWEKSNTGMKPIPKMTLKIRIEYDGVFHAGYGSANKYREGFTTKGSYYEDLGNSNYVDVGAKKDDGSSKLLKLSVLKGNKVVAEKTTRDPYGEVIINYKS